MISEHVRVFKKKKIFNDCLLADPMRAQSTLCVHCMEEIQAQQFCSLKRKKTIIN